MRLDQALVERGLARSRTRATKLLSDGFVLLNGAVAKKASLPVSDSDQLEIVGGEADQDYASRAAHKLKSVLDALGTSGPAITGRGALDVGASTGGFTDILLRQGAAHVIALDVGHDQLVPEIAEHDLVTVIEGYNARELKAEDLPFRPEVVVADVSFISLTIIMPALSTVLGDNADLVLMIKPQFEVGKAKIGAGGVVRNAEYQAGAIMSVIDCARAYGLSAQAIIPSAVPGPYGNREFFVWLKPGESGSAQGTSAAYAAELATTEFTEATEAGTAQVEMARPVALKQVVEPISTEEEVPLGTFSKRGDKPIKKRVAETRVRTAQGKLVDAGELGEHRAPTTTVYWIN